MNDSKTVVKAKSPIKPSILIIIAANLACIAIVGVISYSFGFSQKPADNNTTNLTPQVTLTSLPNQTATPTSITTPTITTEPFEIRPLVTSISKFSHTDLLNADKEQALKFIQKSFDNIQAVNSIGYKYVSSDGEEYGKAFDAKFQIDKKHLGYNYKLTNYTAWGFVDDYNGPTLRRTEEGSNTNSFTGFSDEEISQYFAYSVFQSSRASTKDGNWGNFNDSKYHNIAKLPDHSFTSKEINISNNLKGIEYSFNYNPAVDGAKNYLIWLGDDGLIYRINIPNAYAYNEYSNFEYNIDYKLPYVNWEWEGLDFYSRYTYGK